MKRPYTKPRLVRLASSPELVAATAAARQRALELDAMRTSERRWGCLTVFVAFVVGVLAALAGGCGRVGYEQHDDAGGGDVGSVVDTWSREGGNGACAESFTFNDDSTYSWLMVCSNGTVQRAVGSYELAGDLVRFVPVDACTPPYNRQWAAVWRVDDYVLELNGGSYYRGELATDTEPTELCP